LIFLAHVQETRKSKVEQKSEKGCVENGKELMKLILDFWVRRCKELVCPQGRLYASR